MTSGSEVRGLIHWRSSAGWQKIVCNDGIKPHDRGTLADRVAHHRATADLVVLEGHGSQDPEVIKAFADPQVAPVVGVPYPQNQTSGPRYVVVHSEVGLLPLGAGVRVEPEVQQYPRSHYFDGRPVAVEARA